MFTSCCSLADNFFEIMFNMKHVLHILCARYVLYKVFLNICCVMVFYMYLCRSVCWFSYGPFCHGALKLDIFTSFTTFFLWTSLTLILEELYNYYNIWHITHYQLNFSLLSLILWSWPYLLFCIAFSTTIIHGICSQFCFSVYVRKKCPACRQEYKSNLKAGLVDIPNDVSITICTRPTKLRYFCMVRAFLVRSAGSSGMRTQVNKCDRYYMCTGISLHPYHSSPFLKWSHFSFA